MRSVRLHLAAATFGLLAWSAATAATTIESLSIEKMANVAHTIVRATCVSSTTRFERGEIWTITTFEVTENWKGPALESRLDVYLLGGTSEGLTSYVPGVPRFRVGEDVILFLEPTKHGGLTVVGWQQGTLRILRDPRTGNEIVTQDSAESEVFDPQTKMLKADGVRHVPLQLFRARVESALALSARRKS